MTAATVGRRALVELSEEYEGCAKCEVLCNSRTQVVFGSGSSRGPILVVGEAPGASEDEEGATFVGDSGQLLMDLFAKAWPPDDRMKEIRAIQEDESYFTELREYLDGYVFWTNSAICRPPDNRNPTSVELKNCRERLERTIYAVDPLLIVAAGKIAAGALLGKAVQIMDKHGTLFDVSVKSPITGQAVRYTMLAILHPAFLLRQGDQALVRRKKGPTYETIEELRNGLGLLERLHRESYGRSFLE